MPIISIFTGCVIYHLPELPAQQEILARLAERRARSLDGLKLGAHYGRHYFRPASSMADGPRDPLFPLPDSMERILEALGSQMVEYNRQDLCCGAALSINAGRSEEFLRIAGEKPGWMHEAG